MIKIIIVDDQLLFRVMLKEMLIKDPDIEIVALSSNGDEAIADCVKYKPDIVLLDVRMPGKDGIEALCEIKKLQPRTKVVMLTTFEESQKVNAAIQFCADGYLIKELTPDVLIGAIKCISNDIVLFHKSAYNVIHPMITNTQNVKDKIVIGNVTFDFTEVQIIKLIGNGKSNKEIAQVLNYSEGTIKNKISKILSTTCLADRTELTVFAINNGII